MGRRPIPQRGGGGVYFGGKRPKKAGPQPKPPMFVSQRQTGGRGSISIQSGRDVTNVSISASNGSVVAWNINGDVNIGRPPPPPVQWSTAEVDDTPRKRAVFTDRWLTNWAALHIAVTALVMVTALVGDSWTLMTTLAVIANGAAAGLYGYLVIRRRIATETPDAPDADAQAESDVRALPEPKPLSHWGTRSFFAVCACPNCGDTALHRMRLPSPVGAMRAEAAAKALADGSQLTEEQIKYLESLLNEGDPADADVIRVCVECKQEWGEK